MSASPKPPRFTEWLLKSFCSYDFLATALWDLDELYDANHKSKGRIRANLIQLKEVFVIIFHLYFKGNSQYSINTTAMLRNNFLIAFRSLKKSKSYTLINLLGLSSGITVFLMIFLYATNELSYDSYHEKSDRIYQIYKSVNTINQPDYRDAGTPGPLANALVEEFPEVEEAVRFIEYRNILMEANGKKFVEPEVYPTDPSVFDVFSFDPLSGDVSDFLKDRFTVAISESVALKYFNRTDVVNEVITFQNQLQMTVSGVFKDMPENSHLKLEVLVHFESVVEAFQQGLTNWNNNPYFTYIVLGPSNDAKVLEQKLPLLRTKYADDPMDEDGQIYTYFLQDLKGIRFNKQIQGGLGTKADAQRLYIFLVVAFSVLLMACMNYINMATARSMVRMKEIGVRKLIGAKNKNLLGQSFVESGMLILASIVLAAIVVNLLLPYFSDYVGVTLVLNSFQFLGYAIALLVILTLISGIYPAMVAISMKPIKALKGVNQTGKVGLFKNLLVVFQFAISSVLIVGAIVLSKQMHYIDNTDLGYNRENVIVLSTKDDAIDNRLDTYMEDLRNISGVDAVATSWSLPTKVTSNTEANWPGISPEERLPMYMLGVTYDFFELFEIDFKQGRSFDKEISSDQKAIVLNETAVNQLGWEEPLGRQMITQNGDTGRVIGIVSDFNIQSLKQEIEPLQIVLNPNYATLSVKVAGDINEALLKIEELYQSYSPSYPFTFRYLEDIFNQTYENDRKTADLTLIFMSLTIIIACLGLSGLVAHRIQYRIKELGIRKILGAKVTQLIQLVSQEFLRLLLVAFLIAMPVSYFLMNNWLKQFAYRVNLSVWMFAAGLGLIVLFAALTIGLKSYKTAVMNPVNTLKND